MVQDSCTKCEADLTYLPWVIFYISMYIVFVAYMYLTVKGKKIDAQDMYDQAATIEEMVGTFKILISFLQIFTSLQLTMTIPWADSFREMMDVFKVITIDLSDIFANLNVCSFVTDFSSSF